jgi:hypothetical protein
MSEALIPDMPDTLLMSWSSMQYEWALSHELNVWKTVANERVMYQSKSFEINKWFADGPFTGSEGVPQESPPQLGVWLGWSMVRQYMEKNPAITMTQLLDEKRTNPIRYRTRRQQYSGNHHLARFRKPEIIRSESHDYFCLG